jgi:hypothetical protein
VASATETRRDAPSAAQQDPANPAEPRSFARGELCYKQRARETSSSTVRPSSIPRAYLASSEGAQHGRANDGASVARRHSRPPPDEGSYTTDADGPSDPTLALPDARDMPLASTQVVQDPPRATTMMPIWHDWPTPAAIENDTVEIRPQLRPPWLSQHYYHHTGEGSGPLSPIAFHSPGSTRDRLLQLRSDASAPMAQNDPLRSDLGFSTLTQRVGSQSFSPTLSVTSGWQSTRALSVTTGGTSHRAPSVVGHVDADAVQQLVEIIAGNNNDNNLPFGAAASTNTPTAMMAQMNEFVAGEQLLSPEMHAVSMASSGVVLGADGLSLGGRSGGITADDAASPNDSASMAAAMDTDTILSRVGAQFDDVDIDVDMAFVIDG